LWGFFKPPAPLPTAGAVFLAALVAKCFVGFLFPAVLFLAVYLVLAILIINKQIKTKNISIQKS